MVFPAVARAVELDHAAATFEHAAADQLVRPGPTIKTPSRPRRRRAKPCRAAALDAVARRCSRASRSRRSPLVHEVVARSGVHRVARHLALRTSRTSPRRSCRPTPAKITSCAGDRWAWVGAPAPEPRRLLAARWRASSRRYGVSGSNSTHDATRSNPRTIAPRAAVASSDVIEQLVEQIEERFAELQRQMSDPEVIGDRERYAAVGREYRELERAHELAAALAPAARRPRGRRGDARRGRRRRGAARAGRRGARPAARARGRAAPGDGRARPQRRQERDRRDPRRDRRRRGRAVRRRPLQDAHPLRGGARLCDRGAVAVGGRGRRLQGGHLRDPRRRRLLGVQVRGRHAPRPAGPEDRVAGAYPHLDRDRGRAARGRGGRGRDRARGPPGRRLPLLGARRADR